MLEQNGLLFDDVEGIFVVEKCEANGTGTKYRVRAVHTTRASGPLDRCEYL